MASMASIPLLSSNIVVNNVVVDGRSMLKYDKEHIAGSISVMLPTILAKRVTLLPELFGKINFENDAHFKKILNDKSGTIYYLIDESFLETLRNSLQTFYGECMIFMLYDDYKEQHKNTIELAHTIFKPINQPEFRPPTPDMRNVMSEIMPGLFLGGEDTSTNMANLKEKHIDIIINVSECIPNCFESDFTYHRIPISDKPCVDIRKYFDETFEILNDAIINGKTVLVHCQAGISRSASIVIAYIMKKNKINMNDSYKFVQMKRSCISPNIGFCGQLLLYEKEIMIQK